MSSAERNPRGGIPGDPDERISAMLQTLGSVIRGKGEFLELFLACFLAGGHVLIEDLPGLGKTTVAKTLARLIAGDDKNPIDFKRIQFTPDLLPYDITGVDVFDPDKKSFVFSPGPIFANIVLADEINRTTPKVQSALLEVMAESQVTVGNTTHTLDALFFVAATQNPLEIEGTYPLPVAQLDRFMMRLAIGFPDAKSEFRILKDNPSARVMPEVQPVVTATDVVKLRDSAAGVFVADELIEATVRIAHATREHDAVEFGASPRAGLMLLAAARALALVRGRDFVTDEDLVDTVVPVIAHRLRFKDPRISVAGLLRDAAIEAVDAPLKK